MANVFARANTFFIPKHTFMIDSKTKVLILYNKLFDYRIPIWNILADKCDLTIAYCEGKDQSNECNFKTIRLKDPKFYGQIAIHKENIFNLAKQYDVVIAIGNIRWLKYATLAFRHRKFKFGVWSLGVSASYEKGYDAVTKWDWIRDIFYKAADACIFYTDYVVKKNMQRGYDPKKMFVAHNTVKVLDPKEGIKKDSILFIGTLYPQKGLQLLLESYKEANSEKEHLPDLNIIGGGSEYDNVKNWIESNNLQNKIHLLGPIYDKDIKRDYFQKAFACISPKQAGLSVLESIGYGVPFITRKDAITGGEIFNVINGETGYLLNKDSEFVDILKDIADNPQKYQMLGHKSRKYYLENRTPEIMAQGLYDAIDYMLDEK